MVFELDSFSNRTEFQIAREHIELLEYWAFYRVLSFLSRLSSLSFLSSLSSTIRVQNKLKSKKYIYIYLIYLNCNVITNLKINQNQNIKLLYLKNSIVINQINHAIRIYLYKTYKNFKYIDRVRTKLSSSLNELSSSSRIGSIFFSNLKICSNSKWVLLNLFHRARVRFKPESSLSQARLKLHPSYTEKSQPLEYVDQWRACLHHSYHFRLRVMYLSV